MPLARVAVFLESEVAEGWVLRQEQRVSDGLNRGESLHVQALGATAEPGPWQDYYPDDVIAVAVEPRHHPSPLRVSRRRHMMELSAYPYIFFGTAHMPPGADPLRYAATASQRWLPLTNCTVTSGNASWAVEVLLVNLDRVARALEPAESRP